MSREKSPPCRPALHATAYFGRGPVGNGQAPAGLIAVFKAAFAAGLTPAFPVAGAAAAATCFLAFFAADLVSGSGFAALAADFLRLIAMSASFSVDVYRDAL
ncbi:MAG: hypothetical protein HY777_12925 [Betaproteobacteria bacterium]|nr:hypothetical protein [Betaproteobacteria bacterium]